jgi:FKBP-type peptidyl-prolyl cis-trans isomerase
MNIRIPVFLRVACIVVVALAASACGSSGTAPSNVPPSAPYSQTDLVVGTGATATAGHTVTVSYTGWLYDPAKPDSKGTQFDSAPSFSFVLGAGKVISGWDQGVPGMKVGGQRRLIIPPDLAYGNRAVGAIPPNSTLVFDITLLGVQ